MNISEAIGTHLLTNDDLTQLIAKKVFILEAPAETSPQAPLAAYPYLVLSQSNGEQTVTQDGFSGNENSTIQLEIFALEYSETEAISKQVEKTLNAYRGLMGDVQVDCCLQEDKSSRVMVMIHQDSQTSLQTIIQQYDIWFQVELD